MPQAVSHLKSVAPGEGSMGRHPCHARHHARHYARLALPNYVKNMLELQQTYARIMLRLCQIPARSMPELCQNYIGNLPKYARSMPKICQTCVRQWCQSHLSTLSGDNLCQSFEQISDANHLSLVRTSKWSTFLLASRSWQAS